MIRPKKAPAVIGGRICRTEINRENKMIIYHTDKGGNRWRFCMPGCTKKQAAAFARMLRGVSNTRVYRARATGYRETPAERRNAEFCARVERDILAALADKYPVTEHDERTEQIFGL